jgi:hypothetical protein
MRRRAQLLCSLAVLNHPLPLMVPAFLTHAPPYLRRISIVRKTGSTGSHQSAIERARPLRVALCEPPYLVRGQAQITEHLPERLACADRGQQRSFYALVGGLGFCGVVER